MGQREKQVVQTYLDLVRGDEEEIARAIQTFDPDMTWRLIGQTPASGEYKGLEALFRDFYPKIWMGDGRPGVHKQGLNQEKGIDLMVDEIVSLEDNRVIALCHVDAIGNNGVPYLNEYCYLMTVENDKITKMVVYTDTALIERSIFDKRLVPAELVADIPETVVPA